MLQDTIRKVKAADPSDTEVVYIPAEVEAAQFRGVTKEGAEHPQPFPCMPWEASQGTDGEAGLGFARKKAVQQGRPQGALGVKFGITSLPTLCVLDGKSGRVIHEKFMEEEGDVDDVKFTFSFNDLAPPTWIAAKNFSWSSMLGPSLQTSGGLKPTEDVLNGKKQVALFFGDLGCPYCKAFEPTIQDTIKSLKAADPSDTEVVYIPAEVQAETFRGVTKEGAEYPQPFPCMPWETSQGSAGKAGLGFVRKKGREVLGRVQGALGERFEITAVPRLYVCDGVSGKVLYDGKKFIVENEFEENGKNVISMKFDAEEMPPSWSVSMPKHLGA